MSKSLRNYPDVSEVFDRDGADAMRWFLMSSSVIRGGNLVVTEEGIREGVRQFILPLWNSWYFFALYANSARPDGYEATWRTDSSDVLDRYILAKLRTVAEGVTLHLDALDSPLAANALRDFADVLTNWYVRRSRDRFWTGVADDGSGADAFDTLYTVLEVLSRLAAPLLPLTTERVWKDLTGGRSVHLADWPDLEALPRDETLVATMDAVRSITGSVLSLRKKEGLRVRLPLAELTVVTSDSASLADFESILRDELNVKAVSIVEMDASSAERFGVTSRLTVNARAAGPRLGKRVQEAIRAAKAGDWSEVDGQVTAGGIALEQHEYDLVLEAASGAEGSAVAVLPTGGFVLLDTRLTPLLEAEGIARDMIRAVQDTRKAAGFDVSDRIALDLVLDDREDAAAIEPWTADIARETLATRFRARLASEVDETGTAEHVAVVPAGRFANAGTVTISVARIEGTTE
jgi:isoleucyl-tRNA synthetase